MFFVLRIVSSVTCANWHQLSLPVTLLSIRIAPRYANVNTDRVASISEYATYQSTLFHRICNCKCLSCYVTQTMTEFNNTFNCRARLVPVPHRPVVNIIYPELHPSG